MQSAYALRICIADTDHGSVRMEMHTYFGEFLTLNMDNTKGISYIFKVNTSNSRCVIPLLLCQILIP